LEDFKHEQTAHCENGVTTSLLNHYGIEGLTEPMAFGLGSGLFYIHIPFLKVNHGPAISFRTMPGAIFSRTCKALDVKVKRKKFKNEKSAQAFLDYKLNEGSPVALQVGVYNLSYFPIEYRFHFNAHNIIVYGKENGNYLISDPIMESVTTLNPEDLSKVRFAQGVYAPKGHIYYPENVQKVDNNRLIKGIKKSIKRNSRDMLYAPGGFAGAAGIKYTARKVRKWKDKFGLRKAGLYLGQIVRMQEEIGTGGGGFRFIYSAFLEEAYQYIANDELLRVSEEFTKAGDMWRNNAIEMAGVYKGRLKEQSDFNAISDYMMEIASVEKGAFKRLLKLKL
jgi:hypothetical protein